jgi:hypothetical protein
MTVVVHVAPAELRGVPFARYESVRCPLVGEVFNPDGVTVRPGDATRVFVVDRGVPREHGHLSAPLFPRAHHPGADGTKA